MRDDQLQDLIGSLYEAALDSQLWPDVLRRMAAVMGCSGAMFRCVDALTSRVMFFDGVGYDPALLRQYPERFIHIDPYRERSLTATPGVVADTRHFVLDADRHDRSEYRHEWEIPQDKIKLIGGVAARFGTEAVQVGMHRGSREPEFAQYDIDLLRSLFPHLARAARLRLKLAESDLQRVASAQCIDHLRMGIVFVTDSAIPVYCNRAADEMRRQGILTARADGLAFSSIADTTRFRELLQSAAGVGREPTAGGGGMRLQDASGRVTHQVWVLPLALASLPERLFLPTSAKAMVFITCSAPPPEALSRLSSCHGFSAAEARLAAVLLDGCELTAAAQKLGVSINTAKTQLRAIFAKTGTRRQSELIGLLLQGALVRTPEEETCR